MAILRQIVFWVLAAGSVAGAGVAGHPHPRLLFPAHKEREVRQRLAEDPVAAALHAAHLEVAGRILSERTCRYEIPDGKRLLGESRRAILNVTQTAMAWRLGGGEKFRARAIAELEAACALPDWNPSHFLDTAEMAAAVAIGYDWLYPSLTAGQRKRYAGALIEKALRPAKRAYDTRGWWTDGRNNWGQVCGAGIAMAAVAAWESEPELCAELLEAGIDLVEHCGRFYRPDGVYPEGPAYWHYGTGYQVLMLATCESLGVKMEVEPALRRSGNFIRQTVGPGGFQFNFADARPRRAVASPAKSWIATHFRDPGQSAAVRSLLEDTLPSAANHRYAVLHLLWLPEAPRTGAVPLETKMTYGGEQPLGIFRSGWGPGEAWLAIKGGTGAASHGHLDAGSFVYEAGGMRWFVDLGSDNYNLPGYFGARRWSWFRLNNRSHNTLVIDDRLQVETPEPCPITASGKEGAASWLTLDLGPAYGPQAASVTRRAEFHHATGAVCIEDVLEEPAGAVRWAVLTRAQATISGCRVLLEQNGRTLVVQRDDDAGGDWELAPATPPTPGEKRNEGVTVVSFTAPRAERLTLQVRWHLAAE